MNRTIPILAGTILLAVCAFGGPGGAGDSPTQKREPAYPHAGMSVSELRGALSKVEGLLPAESAAHVLSVSSPDPEHLDIRTGMVAGPLAGRGKRYRFQKTGRKWAKVGEEDWVS